MIKDPELAAITSILHALKKLPTNTARARVIDYVFSRADELGLTPPKTVSEEMLHGAGLAHQHAAA